jgi:hypothetical protein
MSNLEDAIEGLEVKAEIHRDLINKVEREEIPAQKLAALCRDLEKVFEEGAKRVEPIEGEVLEVYKKVFALSLTATNPETLARIALSEDKGKAIGGLMQMNETLARAIFHLLTEFHRQEKEKLASGLH